MKRNIIVSMMVIGIMLCVPITASADSVSWSTEDYSVVAQSSTHGALDSADGPPLPISAYINETTCWTAGTAYSEITTSLMTAEAHAETDCDIGIFQANASFIGTYNSILPYFEFSYDYSFINTQPYGQFNWTFANILITDITDSNNLLDVEFSEGNGTFYIQTPLDHTIQVEVQLEASAFGNDRAYGDTGSYLNYNMSVGSEVPVVPEPISSILFVTGGTLLAGRRFIKRNRA